MKLVSVLGVISSLLVLSGCSKTGSGGKPPLPENAPSGWQLRSVQETPAGAAPASVRETGFRHSWRAEYSGPGTAHVDVYETKAEAAGIDMVQKWRATADTVTFFNARYFVVVRWEKTDRAALTVLISHLEKSLKVD